MAVTRTLLPSDLPALRELLLRLGPDDRRRRFGVATSDSGIAAHVAAVAEAGRDAHVVGAFEDGALVGAAELWFDGDPARDSTSGPLQPDCEIAVVVDTARRGQGIGKRLLERAVLVARNRWARRLHMTCLLENRRMQQLARQFSRELRFEDGSAEADVALPYPSPQSLWAEVVLDAAGFAASGWLPGRAPTALHGSAGAA